MVPTQASSAANALQQANSLLGMYHDGTAHTAAGVQARPPPTQHDMAPSAADATPQPGPSTQRPPARQRRKSEKAREMDGIYETDMIHGSSARRPAAAINPYGVQEEDGSEEPDSSSKRRRGDEYSPGDGEGEDIQAGMELLDGMFIMLQECDLSGAEKPDRVPLPCYFSRTATGRLHGELADFFAGKQHEAYRQRAEEGTLDQSSFFGGKSGRFRKDGSLDVVYFVPCPHPGFFEHDMWVMFTTPLTAKAYCEDWEPENPRPYYVMKRVSPWRQPRNRKRQKTPEAAGGAPEAGPSAVAVDMPEEPPPTLPPASDTLQAWVAAAVEGGQPDAAAAAQAEAEAAQGDGTAPAGAMHGAELGEEAKAAGGGVGGHIAHASGSSTGPGTTARSPTRATARAPARARAAAAGTSGDGYGHGMDSNMPINAQAVLTALFRSQMSMAATATTQAAAATKAQVQPLQDGAAHTGPAAPPLAVTRRPSAGSGASAGTAPPAVITLIPGQASKAAKPRQGSQPGTVPGPSGTTHRPATIDGLANTAPAGSAGMVETTGASGLRAAILEGLKRAGVLNESCRVARAQVATKETELAAARQESAARDLQLGLHLITVKQMAARLDPPQIVPTLAGTETPSFSSALQSNLETAEALCTALEAELKQRGQAVRMTERGKAAAKAACVRAQQELFEADSSPATFGRAQQKVGEANAAYSEAVALWTAATEALNACQEQHAAAQAARDTAWAPVLAFLRQRPTTT